MRLDMAFIRYFILIFLIFSGSAFGDLKTSVLGFGCFWCSQHDMEKIKGVISAIPGYSGGELKNPSYPNHEGHIEVVKVTYDQKIISFGKLLEKFWRLHDPYDGEGSFCDRGHSYRNVIFYGNESEKEISLKSKKEIEEILKQKVKTLILPTKFFTRAEEYHQHYAKKNPLRYKAYRWNCGRDKRLLELWKSY